MGVTPDSFPGTRVEDELQFTDQGSEVEPSEVGAILQSDGVILAKDSVGVFDVRGLHEDSHEILDTLTHALTETHDVIVTRSSGKVSEILSEIPAPTGTDIRKFEVLSRSSGKVATFRVTQYDSNGSTVKRQLDATVNRSGGQVTSVNVVRTV